MNRLSRTARAPIANDARRTAPSRRSRAGARALLRCAIGLLVVSLGFVGSGRAQVQMEEYKVKAAFLFHFIQLVEWPTGALGDEKSPLTVCTVGKDPFQGDLETTLQGKLIGVRSLRVQHFKTPQEVQGCQVLFIGSDRAQIPAVIAALKNGAVLTVGETDDFAAQGGMIGFCAENNKIRFEINVQAADRAKLKISSRLLLLAKTVIGARE